MNPVNLIVAGALLLSACGQSEAERVACEQFVSNWEQAKSGYFKAIEENREAVLQCTRPIELSRGGLVSVVNIDPEQGCLLALGHRDLAAQLYAYAYDLDYFTRRYRELECRK